MARIGRWLRAGMWIAATCFLALAAYDAVAVLLLHRGSDVVPAHEWLQGVTEDAGLAVAYGLLLPVRVLPIVTDYSTAARRACLIMLGLGLAWYEVLCAFATRQLEGPPDLLTSGIVLFAVPFLAAPWYVRWIKSRVPRL